MPEIDFLQLGVLLFGSAAVAAIAYVVAHPFISGDRQKEKRVSSVTESRSKKVTNRAAVDNSANRRKAVADTLKDIEQRQRKQKLSLRMRLQRAGLDVTPKAFWLSSAGCGAVCALLAMFTLPNNSMTTLATVAGGFIGMFGLPRYVLARMTKRRQAKFLGELANSLDVVTRGIKSGLPLNECLNIISRESPEPLSGEFREVVEQQRVGVTLGEALDRMCERMPLQEVRFLAIVIAIQQSAGGNLSEALGNLSSVMRDRYRMAMRVKALASEAKASAFILASLPPTVMIMVSIASPDFIEPLFTTRTGTVFITIGLAWMGIGSLVMRKMINFKY